MRAVREEANEKCLNSVFRRGEKNTGRNSDFSHVKQKGKEGHMHIKTTKRHIEKGNPRRRGARKRQTLYFLGDVNHLAPKKRLKKRGGRSHQTGMHEQYSAGRRTSTGRGNFKSKYNSSTHRRDQNQ